MWSLWQSCCQATQNIFQTVLCCNPLGNVTEKKQNKTHALIAGVDLRGDVAVTLGAAPLPCAHTRSSASCTGVPRLYVGTLPLFFPRGIMGFCALLHLFWWLTVHHGWGREGTVNCALFQQIIVPSVDDANTAFDQRAHFQCLSFLYFLLLLLLLLRVSRAQWTSWSRRRTWLSWWGAAAGESSLLALSRSVQVSRGDRNVSSVQPNLWKIEVDLTNQLLLKPPRWQAASF